MTKVFAILLIQFVFHTIYAQDTTSVEALLEKSNEYLKINTDSVFYYAHKALSGAQKINYTKGIAKSYSRFGSAYNQEGKYDSALYFHKISLSLRTQKDSAGIASDYTNIGITFKDMGSYDSATYYTQKAYTIYKNLHDSKRAAGNLSTLANIEREIKNFANAQNYLNEAEEIYEQLKDTSALTNVYINKGNLYDTQGDSIMARNYYTRALELSKIIQNTRNEAKALCGLSNSFLNVGDFNKALYFAQSADTLYSRIGDIKGKANIQNTIGIIYLKNKNYNNAIPYFLMANSYFKEMQSTDFVRDVYYNLSVAYAALHDNDNAYLYLAKSDTLKDALFAERRIALQDSLSKNFDAQYQNEKLRQKNIISLQQLKTKTLQRNIFIGSASVLFILFVLFYFNFRQKQRLIKNEIELAHKHIDDLISTQEIKSLNAMMEGQETERKRIAQDLHDRIGSLLSAVKLHFNSLETKIKNYQSENKSQFIKLNTLLDEAVVEVRSISHNLVSGVLLQFGFVPALRELCDSIENTGRIKIDFITYGIDSRLENQTEISIYRIVQELLSNILKHAQATEVTIQLTRHDHELTILVEDNGRGFDTKKEYSGIGIKNIISRIEKLNGTFTLDSLSGKGTTCIVTLKLAVS